MTLARSPSLRKFSRQAGEGGLSLTRGGWTPRRRTETKVTPNNRVTAMWLSTGSAHTRTWIQFPEQEKEEKRAKVQSAEVEIYQEWDPK